jgi:hydrogenase expression/formation protein HypC
MKVLEVHETTALCEGRNGRQLINTMLLEKVEAGQWLLTFLDAGREVIDAERAELVNAALDDCRRWLMAARWIGCSSPIW